MSMEQYLSLFVAETREHLQALDLAVIALEANPGDRENIDAIFRGAHTLKGMSASMGFEAMAALTHEMEDVLELLRQRRNGLPPAAIDVVLACLDALRETVEQIALDGVERLDPDPLTARLKSLVRARTAREPRPQVATLNAVAAQREAAGRPLVRVTVELAPGCAMPGVRALMALRALGTAGELIESVPAADGLEGFGGRRVEAFVVTEAGPEAVAAPARAVPEVVSVVALPVAAAANAPAPAAPRAVATVRVDAERLDALMHHTAELVVHRTHVEALAAQARVPGLDQAVQDLVRSSQALQAMVMQVRMVSVQAVFLRFPRMVRDLAAKLGKAVELELEGQDTEVDRTVVDALGDPLVHLIRNAIDHGFETEDARRAAGKAPAGRLCLSARHQGSHVVITVTDDGAGIDPARVAAAAAERGLIAAGTSLDGAQAADLLFAPGFSTAADTSDVSGRGVGMDAVRAQVRSLGGEVTLTSEAGRGTVAEIRLPLTLAIVPALIVEAAGEDYAIPVERVDRTLSLAGAPVHSIAGAAVLALPDGVRPLLNAGAVLAGAPEAPAALAVIVRAGGRSLALAVDRVVGQRELVARPLPPHLDGRTAVSGGAVLPDGAIALIVDCDALPVPSSHVLRAA